MSSPTMMKALTTSQWPKAARITNLITFQTVGKGVAAVKEVPVPTPRDNQVLVKVTTVALNPTDWKHVDFIAPAGSIVGCDYAGVIEKVSKSNPSAWMVGDRVGGAVHGGLYHDRGSFAQYLVMDDDLLWKIPDSFSDAEAASMGVSALTGMQALNLNLGVPWLDEEQVVADSEGNLPTILIYAGSTTAGLMAIQLAKASGYQVVTTCSPHSYDLVKSYGAAAAFDYNSPTAIADIVKAYPKISIAMDCFSEGQSTSFCGKVMAENGGKVVTLLPGRSKTPGLEIKPIMAYTLMGEPFQWFAPIGPKFAAVPEDRAAAARFAKLMPSYMGTQIKPPPLQEVEGGFDGLLKGLDMLRQKKVSGKKLVVHLKA